MALSRFPVLGILFFVQASAQLPHDEAPVELPRTIVVLPRVANGGSSGTFEMPVTALRFEPLVELQTRNLGEAQADLSIRGGTFENSGIRVGAISLYDPQTGHYLTEIPIPPAMLATPTIVTGSENAVEGMNANAGTVMYGWRPVGNRGEVGFAFGQNEFNRQHLYQGVLHEMSENLLVGGDVEVARSASDGPVEFGDHHFDRVAGRIQIRGKTRQTDVFAGYQAKFFGWTNLYTPFNSAESENLKTTLITVNHRSDLGSGDYLQGGIYFRRNVDDYRFNRFAPVGAVLPFFHTTWLSGVAIEGRQSFSGWALAFNAQAMADELEST